MAYVPIVPKEDIIAIMGSIIAIGNTVNTNRQQENAGGFVLSEDMLNKFQRQGESYALQKLTKYYYYPLQTDDGITDFNLFPDLIQGTIYDYLLACTCETIANFAMTSTGVGARAKFLKETYVDQKMRSEELFFRFDKVEGQVYPALVGLKYNDIYIPRQNNPVPLTASPNTRYNTSINTATNIGSAGWTLDT